MASIAWRSGWWMVTKTVLSSRLANIMRTGSCSIDLCRCCAAKACSISVCPGNFTPANASASLCSGAVTIADTSPRKAAWVAHVMLSAASWPAIALIFPKAGSCSCASGPPTCWIESPSCIGIGLGNGLVFAVTTCHARCITALSPTTMQLRNCSGAWQKALTMISGPMPAASPIVMAMGFLSTGIVRRAQALKQGCRCR